MRTEVLALASDLIAVDSVNPALVRGGAGEGEAAELVAGWARDAGLEVRWLEAHTDRPSVLVRAPGTGGGRTLLLCGHLDTVALGGSDAGLEPRVDGDRLHGRGAYDMKGALAAALVATRAAAELGLAGDVVVAAVADEEHASLGVVEALSVIEADAAIVVEPTELAVAIAHKGFVWGEITVHGVAAHGSRPALGRDAIVAAGPILTALGELDAALAGRPHPLLERGSVHAGTIAGGVELSSYPDRCVIGVERRTLPGETAGHVELELAALVGEAEASVRVTLVREPFEIDPGAELVGLVRAAAGEVLGRPAEVGGVSYWADSAFIAAAGIPTVLFGPVGAGAHAAPEWVSITSLEQVARTLVATAQAVCG